MRIILLSLLCIICQCVIAAPTGTGTNIINKIRTTEITLSGESRTNWPVEGAGTNLSEYNNDVPFLTPATAATNIPQFPAMREPTGFPDITNSVMSLGTNGVFILAGTNFPGWYRGTQLLLNSQTNTLPAISGIRFIYLTSSGVLSNMSTPWVVENADVIPVAIAYYNTIQGYFACGDERHGITMDALTHAYLHETLGTRYEEGGALTYFVRTTGSPSGNTNSQVAMAAPLILWDEDLKYTVTTNAGQKMGQNLGYPSSTVFQPAYIPAMYKTGPATNTAWRTDTATAYPFKIMTNGTGQLVAGYNINIGGIWTNVAPANGNATVYWIYMVNNCSNPIVSIPHNASYADVATAASQSSPSQLFTDGLFMPEMKLLYRLIFFNQDYTTDTDTRLSQVDDYRLAQPLPVASQTTASHASLNNLEYSTSGHSGFQPAGDYLTNGATGTSTNLSGYNNDVGFLTNAPAGTTNHSELAQLDYASAGHTGFQPAGDYLTNGAPGTGTNLSQYNNDVGFLTNSISGTTNHSELAQLDYASAGHSGFQPAGDYVTNGQAGTSTNLSGYNNDVGFITNAVGGVTNHNELNNLDYANSGHTGFMPMGFITNEIYGLAVTDTTFSVTATNDFYQPANKSLFDIIRGRVHTVSTNTPFSKFGTLTWYISTNRHSANAFWQGEIEFIAQNFSTNIAEGSTSVQVPDNTSYYARELLYFSGTNSEYVRIGSVGTNGIITLQDSLVNAYASNDVVHTVGEYGGFSGYNLSESNMLGRITFGTNLTETIRVWTEFK